MSHFTTHLSLTLLVKEFLRLVNIGKVTGKIVDCSGPADFVRVRSGPSGCNLAVRPLQRVVIQPNVIL